MTASITCPRCGRTSWNPNDVREGYCGACHAYTSSPAPVPSSTSVEVRVAWGPDARPYVLLQLEHGYALTDAASARRIAALILNVADEVDELGGGAS